MRVALLGTGLMGFPMVQTLIGEGHEVTAYNRTREKAEPLREEGATIAETSSEAITSAECTILMLTDAPAIEAELFGDSQIDFTSKTILQMGTIAPEESRDFAKLVKTKGGDYFEAPVLGNKSHAAKGELFVMVGGTESQFQRWKILLSAFGSLHHVGPVGSAAALKLALNQLIASLTAAFGLSLALVRKNDVHLELFMDILRDSALYSPQFDKKLPRILQQDYDDPNFPTKHLLKDVDLIVQAAESAGIESSGIVGVRQVIKNAMEKGYDETDYSSLVEGLTG